MENTASETIRMKMMESANYPEAAQTSQVEPNHLANIWLAILFIIMTLTVLCTGVLVAWPILAKVAARFTEM